MSVYFIYITIVLFINNHITKIALLHLIQSHSNISANFLYHRRDNFLETHKIKKQSKIITYLYYIF